MARSGGGLQLSVLCSENLEEVRRALEELAELEDLEIAQHARAAVATTAWRVNVEPASAAVSLGDGGHKSLPSMSLAVLSVPFLCPAARSPRQAGGTVALG